MNEAQKHLVWIRTDPLETLGIATWLFTTQELRKAGWKVTLIAADDSGIHEKLGVEYLGIPKPNVYLIRQLIFHFRVLVYFLHLAQPPDVIMYHEMSLLILTPFRLIRKILGIKRPLFVLDIRSLPMEPAEISGLKDRLRSIHFYLANWLANRGAVDGRVVITEAMGKVLNIPADKLWGIWASGVQLEMFATASRIRNWENINQQVNLIYIGTMSDGRNLAVFARALIAANREGMKFSMIYIGEGAEMPDLLLLEKEGQGCIRVVPHVPFEQIQEWLAKAHIGVLPFPDEVKFRVSSFIKLREYAASGLAILATRIESHTSVMDDGNFVIWANESTVGSFLDALRHTWLIRDSLSEMGKQAMKAAGKFTWAESAANLGEALDLGLSKYG